MTKDRCVDNSCATPTIRTLRTPTVCCSLPGHYSTYMYVPSAEEGARYKAKVLVTNKPLASLVTKPCPTNHTSQCVISLYCQMLYRYCEKALLRIIACNNKKNDKRQVNKKFRKFEV